MIHPKSDCLSKNIGEKTNIWQNVVVLPNAVIGNNCNICLIYKISSNAYITDNSNTTFNSTPYDVKFEETQLAQTADVTEQDQGSWTPTIALSVVAVGFLVKAWSSKSKVARENEFIRI